MPQKRISFSSFDRRLVVAGGREQTGLAGLRRASGVAPEQTTSIMSRWGSPLLYPNIGAIQLYYWGGDRYAYDGTNLYKNGVIFLSGFDGSKLTFNSMPPGTGVEDYLFILGGGKTPFKIAPDGTTSNWGIVAPLDGMQARTAATDTTTIDTFDSSAANWTPVNCSVANESTIVQAGTGSLKITPTAGPWSITWTLVSTLNLAVYADNIISLTTDYISLWFNCKHPTTTIWLEVLFDVNDGSFKKDYYSAVIQVVPTTANKHAADAAVIISAPADAWFQVAIAKSQWLRTGTNLNLDWSMVQAIRIQGGYLPPDSNPPQNAPVYVDNFTMFGGYPLGTGPIALQGGATFQYQVTYGNDITGNDSNPNDTPLVISNVAEQPVVLYNVPISSDPQVTNRKLWRTQEGGAALFYLDKIPDNTTTTYTDVTSSIPMELILTPWVKNVTILPAYYVNEGNGYYAFTVSGGTTGNTPPNWNIPTTTWAAKEPIDVAGETLLPSQTKTANYSAFKALSAGVTGVVEPNWLSVPSVGDTIVDGTVTWQNIGPLITSDGLVNWQTQGLNAVPVLGNDEVLLDNAPPLITYGDAYGPFQGSMFWTRDSYPGNERNVYASPPGRPESVGQVYFVSSQNDPMQKLMEYDGVLWALSQDHAFYAQGTYPSIAFVAVMGAHGTTQPYTLTRVHGIGLIYWAHDGIRILSWGSSRLIAFPEISPILRGQMEENIPAWSYLTPPTWSARIKDEILFSDGQRLTLALAYDGLKSGELIWRVPGPVMTAAYHDEQTGEVQASWGQNIYQFEQPGTLLDGSNPIAFEVQSPGDFPDPGAQFTTQRLYIAANLNVSAVGQVLTPTLIIDGVERTLPVLPAKSGRFTYELAPKMVGRLFDGVRLTGNLTGRVEIYNISADVWLGEQQE